MTLWRRWVVLLSRREGGESLALVRILLGAVVLVVLWRDYGVARPLWLGVDHGGYRSLNVGWLIEGLGGPTPSVVYGLMLTAAVSATALLVGLLPRIAALLTLQIVIALTDLNGHASGSDDLLLSNALWLLVLADSGATWSVMSRIREGTWRSARQVSAWPRYLIIGQLVVMYTATGLQKVSAHWVPGGDLGALYYILQQPAWYRAEMPWLADVFVLTQAATLGTWLFEVGAPVFLLAYWYRDTRTRPGRLRAVFNRLDVRSLLAFSGIALHVGIHIMMAVGPFSMIALSMYPAFWHPEEWRALRRRRGARQTPGQTSRRGATALPEA